MPPSPAQVTPGSHSPGSHPARAHGTLTRVSSHLPGVVLLLGTEVRRAGWFPPHLFVDPRFTHICSVLMAKSPAGGQADPGSYLGATVPQVYPLGLIPPGASASAAEKGASQQDQSRGCPEDGGSGHGTLCRERAQGCCSDGESKPGQEGMIHRVADSWGPGLGKGPWTVCLQLSAFLWLPHLLKRVC